MHERDDVPRFLPCNWLWPPQRKLPLGIRKLPQVQLRTAKVRLQTACTLYLGDLLLIGRRTFAGNHWAICWAESTTDSQGKGNIWETSRTTIHSGASHYASSFFNDLQKRPHSVQGEPARKISFHFNPSLSFTVPDATRRALEDVEPRDIDLTVWRKLAGAAARLSEADLACCHQYPFSLYRSVALLWITTAHRPNELQRLRLDCVRREWDHEMIDEDGLPLEPGEDILASETGKAVCYLRIPTNKYGGEFWIWIPQYTADAIDAWKKDRGMANEALYDAKDRTFADLLFCQRGKPLGDQFLNEHLIPLLCRVAGDIPSTDAKGRFTGHRGRSTRITLLRRCGMDLDDLDEYAGHKNTATIRHYARTDPLQLHRKIAKADALFHIIEGLIDMDAASRGQPSVRWFLGYDADGLPQFCGLPAYQTCPHRMDCPHCGLFIGGEKAKLLSES